MKKLISLLAFCFIGSMVYGQTIRQFTLRNSADGESTLTCFLPEKPTGKAIVGCPGGGYSHLSMQNEGTDWAGYFNSQGIAYFVLKYRMPNGDRMIPMSDAFQAIKTVRDSATQWKINPYDVGIMGFSAGGHLASTVSTHADLYCRPDFSILFYPVISMDEKVSHQGSVNGFLGELKNNPDMVNSFSNDKQVRRHLTPPCVVLLANDDRAVPPVTNGVAYYVAMRNKGNNAAMYIYPTGGHGFGFRSTFKYHDQMINDLQMWLKTLNSPKQNAIRVACIGNSITDGSGIDMSEDFGYPAQLQNLLGDGYNVRNYGVSARTLLNTGDRPYTKELAWNDALNFKPNIVVIKLGTNDSKDINWVHGKDFQQDLQQMVDSLKNLPSKPLIYLATPIPAFKSSWTINDSVIVNGISPIIYKVAKKNKCRVIDLHTLFRSYSNLMQRDGIHPTEKGAGQIAQFVFDSIKGIEKQ